MVAGEQDFMIEKTYNAENSETKRQYIATCCVSLGAICAGTVLAWTSPVVPQLKITTTNLTNSTDLNPINSSSPIEDLGLQLTETQCGMVGSMLALGALISSIPAGFLAERFGRKWTILSLSIPFILNWILIVFAQNAETIYAGRFFAGLATGAICVCAPMYIGEIADASIRGRLGSFFQMFLCAGILATYVIGALVPWKVLSIILAGFPVLFAVCFFAMPETPAYLVKINQIDLAVNNLKYFRGQNFAYQKEIETLTFAAEEAARKKVKLSDLVVSKGNRKALVASLGVMVFQQLSGINAVIFYTVPIFQSAGSSLSADLSAILVGVLQLIAAYAAAMLIERANRKFYLMFSSVGMMICLSALALYFQLQKLEITSGILNILPIASLLLFIVAFSFGFGPVPWMVMSELFAPEIKGLASGLAVMTNWILVFVVTFAFPLMNLHFGGHVTFLIFAILMALATVFVHFAMPETRGKSLVEIQRILNS